ncbi:BRCA1-associated RING domain protein 1-like isoform X2 [Primulina huaijiensis]|uniref:BRCA1-associated RING domain protein 1-like isoform X2 n=1 Tax=Primulina huaijiensis TaxID=1492673 RepID=UPI003CC75A69
MSDPRKAAGSLNPLVFNFRKLGLELKCPFCLNLLRKPTLLPCNHIFCNVCIPKSSQFTADCPSCQQQFTDQEIRPAPYVDNFVAIYKNLDAAFSSTLLPMFSADMRTPILISNSAGQLRKELSEIAPKNKHSGTSLEDELDLMKKIETCGVSKDGNCEKFDRKFECRLAPKSDQKSPLHRCPMEKNVANFRSVSEESEMNHAPELTPGSSPSDGGNKYKEDCNTDPGSGNGFTEKSAAKSCAKDALVTLSGEVDNKTDPMDTFHKKEIKRQKKLYCGSSDEVTRSREYNKDYTVLDVASYMDGSTCAFCHSSKITDGSGPMQHCGDGKEVARGETTLSKVIAAHRKCVEWSPKVYYVGESIKNLESELERAAKLKCSSCGVKGAALGCFAKSCCRSYHVPCAVEIPDCRWNCDEFLMLCPAHKSMKFPSEKSNSRKRERGENQSLSTQRSIEQSFWSLDSLSPSGPQQWVLCGSALSSEEKHMMIKFASIFGAEVSKSWNSNVTHMIVATNEKGACSRTFKVLMAILNGRWVLNIDWVKSCMEAKYPVDEENYEVELDNRGVLDGPRTGRLRTLNNAPKLFDGLRFYFLGDFVPAYKSGLLALVIDGGGTVIESLELIAAQRDSPEIVSRCLVVYNAQDEANTRTAEAGDLAKDNDARAIPHTWILESIAAHRLLS